MSHAALLTFAMLLDAALGEPRWLWLRYPHPAVLLGRVIARADAQLNTGTARKLRGIIAITALVIAMLTLGKTLALFGWLPELILAAILLAQRSLVDHVRAVGNGLRLSLGEGRRAVAMIVSRDTADMDQDAVARSAIESAAENLSDGVIAPAFWFLIAGLPGILIYKAVNTADSMIGYRTPRHEEFGWAAARLDDLLNWIPARLTALLIAATHSILPQWQAITAEAKRHRSPNAGWPEAAMARALNVAISGPRAYHGEMRDYPFVNPMGHKDLGPDDIDAACAVLWRIWGATLAMMILIALI